MRRRQVSLVQITNLFDCSKWKTSSNRRYEAKKCYFRLVDWSKPFLQFRGDMIQKRNHEVSSILHLWTVSWNIRAMNLSSSDSRNGNGNVEFISHGLHFTEPLVEFLFTVNLQQL